MEKLPSTKSRLLLSLKPRLLLSLKSRLLLLLKPRLLLSLKPRLLLALPSRKLADKLDASPNASTLPRFSTRRFFFAARSMNVWQSLMYESRLRYFEGAIDPAEPLDESRFGAMPPPPARDIRASLTLSDFSLEMWMSWPDFFALFLVKNPCREAFWSLRTDITSLWHVWNSMSASSCSSASKSFFPASYARSICACVRLTDFFRVSSGTPSLGLELVHPIAGAQAAAKPRCA
jgi:hypothetical protein